MKAPGMTPSPIPETSAVDSVVPSACADALGSSGWQPIESAPDETPVWLCENGTIWIGERVFDGDGWLWGNTYMAVYQHPDGTWASSDNDVDDNYQPTHWQPLPAPPSAQEKP